MPDDERVIALDRVLANLDKSQVVPKNVEGVKADPPTIFFSKTPAVIVNLDGEPIWSPIKDNDLKFAVNTNWDLFQHAPDQHLLPAEQRHLAESDRREGAVVAGRDAARQLQEAAGRGELEGRQGESAGQAGQGRGVPKVFVSSQPAELILLTGEPNYLLVHGHEAPVGEQHRERCLPDGQDRSGLLSRRRALVLGAGLHRPVDVRHADRLPADFKKIPLEHERSRVLASVPGTDQAAEAVLLAQIPQTARVNKKEVKAPDVAFQGDAAVHADREDHGRARGQHRQGRLQGRRRSTTCATRACGSSARRANGPVGGRRVGAAGDLPDSRQLAGASRHLRHDRGRR